MSKLILHSKKATLIISLITSTLSGLLVYLILRLLSDLSVLYFSYDLNIKAKLLENGVHFLTPVTNPIWTRDAIITISLAPPILNFFIAFFSMIIFTLVKYKSQSFSFFLQWTIIFSLANTFGSFAENGLFKTGIYKALELMHFGGVIMIIIIMISLYFLYLSGVGIGRIAILNIPDNFWTKNKISLWFYFAGYIIPWMLILSITYSFLPKNNLIIYLFSIVTLIPMIWAKKSLSDEKRFKPMLPFSWIDLVTLIIFIIGSLIVHSIFINGYSF